MNSTNIIGQRLNAQQMTQHSFAGAAELVGYMGAVQAQDFAAAKWALGLRMPGATDEAIEQAFNDGKILRTHVMRPTWHFVTPADIRWVLELTAPRVKLLCAYGNKSCGLDNAIFKKSNKTLTKALEGGNHLDRKAIAAALQKAGIATNELRFTLLMMNAELDGVVCSGPRQGKQFTYALLDERVPSAKTRTREEALTELAMRYFTSHGPATLQDFTWWSGLTMTDAKQAIAMIKNELMMEVGDGREYWHSANIQEPGKHTKQAWLLPNYDEYVVGYKDRSLYIDPILAPKLTGKEPLIFSNTILIDGHIAGTWKRTILKDKVQIAPTLFTIPNKANKAAIDKAIKHYGQFMGKACEVSDQGT